MLPLLGTGLARAVGGGRLASKGGSNVVEARGVPLDGGGGVAENAPADGSGGGRPRGCGGQTSEHDCNDGSEFKKRPTAAGLLPVGKGGGASSSS